MEPIQSLEAVYYPHAVPPNRATLTLLALVYDKVHFPGVLIPRDGLSGAEIDAEIARVGTEDVAPLVDPGWHYMPQLLRLMPYRDDLEEFCRFPEGPDAVETGGGPVRLERDTAGIIEDFTAIVGARNPSLPKPVPITIFSELRTGGVIGAPGWPTYSANAFVYAVNNNLPLVNDESGLPFPMVEKVAPENRARHIATNLALRSMRMVLPETVALTPREIVAFRRETRDLVRPFRDSLTILAADVAALVKDTSDPAEIAREINFITEAKVLPQVRELRRFIQQPGKPWYRRFADAAREAPTFLAGICLLPPHYAAELIAARIAAEVFDVGAEMMAKMDKAKANPAYYLLRISEDLG